MNKMWKRKIYNARSCITDVELYECQYVCIILEVNGDTFANLFSKAAR